ncbi:MAG TPA: hypothetical protein VMU07_03805 [Candidatus Paceibacterota bacterium]|nr:hypothetical protein [Candidatus Paceibacterota bacterium]
MNNSRFLVWGFASGLLTSAIVTYWPGSWVYAPGLIFGATLAVVFSKRAFGTFGPAVLKEPIVWKLVGFIVVSVAAYYAAVLEAQWLLGMNGFVSFAAYSSENALSAVYVACFVGGCIWALGLSLGIRIFFFPFDMIRGMFLFAITAGTVGSIIIITFEIFGFIPQFIFPVWHLCMSLVIMYLYRTGGKSRE